jgi:hypothetical protein
MQTEVAPSAVQEPNARRESSELFRKGGQDMIEKGAQLIVG